MFLTFDADQKCIDALTQINSNAGYSHIGRDRSTGKEVPNKQQTIGWAPLVKAHEINKWYFEKPSVSLMTNVLDYTDEEFDPLWLEPVEQE